MSHVIVALGVAEPLGDDLDVDAGLERERRPRVADVMEADARHAVAGDAAIELARETIRVVRPAVGMAEHETPVVVGGPDEQRVGNANTTANSTA